MQKQHEELRRIGLVSSERDYKAKGYKEAAKIVRRINKAEIGLKTYRILKAMRGKGAQKHAMDRIEVPDSWPEPQHIKSETKLEDPKKCKKWKPITDPDQIEKYLIIRNQRHFGQAQGTPFTEGELAEDIDWAASSAAADKILAGTYEWKIDDQKCTAVLKACQIASDLEESKAELTENEFKGKIKCWGEATTTSPSGRHLGHYKSLFAEPTYDKDEQEEEYQRFKEKQQQLRSLVLDILNYCIRNTIVLPRWKTIVNTMIFKDAGCIKIHRLRVIHIYEADYNLLLAVKWRQLIRESDKQGRLHQGQYGGRPGCEAQSLALLEELKCDLAYTTRRTLLNLDLDASSCYDRIVMSLASLVNRKYGMNKKVVMVDAKTLHEAQYKLRTSLGMSKTSYSHCMEFPIHGSGQGSGNSPAI